MAFVDEQTVEIIKNEYLEIMEILTPRVVMRRLPPEEGSLLLLEFTVNAPTYYITGSGDTNPKATDSIKFFIDVKNGFPKVKPDVYYEPGKILASINAFTIGVQCIDTWHYDEEHAGSNSTLVGTVRKTIMDIIHDPVVSRYDSMANSSLATWQKNKTAAGEFPTCRLSNLLKSEGDARAVGTPPPVPVRSVGTPPPVPARAMRTPPPLPTR